MKTSSFLLAAIVSSQVMGAALPVKQQHKDITLLPDHGRKAAPALENRAIHTSCIIGMGACLAGYGLLNFEFTKTYISSRFINPWTLCASKAILDGSCQDGIGNAVLSEPGQMFSWHRSHKLLDEEGDCTNVSCDNPGGFDQKCKDAGCYGCGGSSTCVDNLPF